MPRTDIHRPSVIDPKAYRFVACDYYGSGFDALAFISERQALRAHMARTGGHYASHDHGGTCHVCGALALSVAVYHHPESNRYIVLGMDCAEKMDCADAVAFRSFRTKLRHQRELKAGRTKAERTLADRGLSRAWDAVAAAKAAWDAGAEAPYEERTINDLVNKLIKYGSLSDAQWRFMGSLFTRIDERAEREAARKAAHEAAAPVPVSEQRMTIRGRVISIKREEFMPVRMLIETADGWRVFGTMPLSLAEVARGATVEFTARVKRSERDEKFGFFSRPAKARIVA